MNNKWFLKSKTLWGGIIAFLPAFLNVVGLQLPIDAETLGTIGLEFLSSANEVIGVVLLIWGRWSAPGTRLTFTP